MPCSESEMLCRDPIHGTCVATVSGQTQPSVGISPHGRGPWTTPSRPLLQEAPSPNTGFGVALQPAGLVLPRRGRAQGAGLGSGLSPSRSTVTSATQSPLQPPLGPLFSVLLPFQKSDNTLTLFSTKVIHVCNRTVYFYFFNLYLFLREREQA